MTLFQAFCREQHPSFQMDDGPYSSCGVWFLIFVGRQWYKLTRHQRTIYLHYSSGEEVSVRASQETITQSKWWHNTIESSENGWIVIRAIICWEILWQTYGKQVLPLVLRHGWSLQTSCSTFSSMMMQWTNTVTSQGSECPTTFLCGVCIFMLFH